MTIEDLKRLNGTDGNEACHAFWDECGAELLALWEAMNNRLCANSEQEWSEAGEAMETALFTLNLRATNIDA